MAKSKYTLDITRHLATSPKAPRRFKTMVSAQIGELAHSDGMEFTLKMQGNFKFMSGRRTEDEVKADALKFLIDECQALLDKMTLDGSKPGRLD